MNVVSKLHRSPSPALRVIVGALLLTLAGAGGLALSSHKTVTLNVDGTAMTVTTMKSRVADIIEENGLTAGDRDELVPAAEVSVRV